ncbi:MAG: JmjC domain-containing protein [Arenicella sp.]
MTISFMELFHPLDVDVFREHFDNNRCLVVEGQTEKFLDLVTAQDIERRLNDGCNFSLAAQIIQDGSRRSLVDADTCWSPSSLQKAEFLKAVRGGSSFMLPNASQVTPAIAQFIDEMEHFFIDEKVHADVHLYISTQSHGNSYYAHRDYPQHKLLLQAVGDTKWTIYQAKPDIPDNLIALNSEQEQEWLEPMSEFVLRQGDLLYMPPATFHKVKGLEGARLSISIPFYSNPHANQMDRTFIPFTDIFQQEGN